jgi:hypothetical protein
MAYVRKTDEMQDGVLRKVRDMKDKALNVYQDNRIEVGTEEYNAVLQTVENAAFRDAPHLREQYPDTWRRKVRGYLNLTFLKSDGTNDFSTTIEVDGVRLPAHIDSGSYRTEVSVKREDCTELLRLWYDQAGQRNKARQQVAEQYSNVETQLRMFMRGHSSLNTMLKEMPEFEMYVPQKFMDKFNAESAPRAKKPQQQTMVEELAIDRDAIAALAIANRMTS